MIAALAGGLAATVALAQSAPEADTLGRALAEIAELRAQNERLARKVEGLEARIATGTDWLTEERAAEIRAIVSDVLADGATRASLSADGATAGYDPSKGFFLASADGNYSLSVKGDVQVRWAYDSRDIGAAPAAGGSPPSTSQADAWGFELRRTRLTMAGNVIDPSWTYFIQSVWSRTGSDTLNDAYLEKALGDGYTLRMGQFKAPFLREELVSAMNQLAVERSTVNDVFTTARSQGLRLGWSDETVRVEAFYGDALRANATGPFALSGGNPVALNAAAAQGVPASFNTTSFQNQSDYAFAGRLEFKPSGSWKQFRDMQSYRGEDAGTLFGVAAYAERVDPIASTGASPESIWSVTADATFDFGGATVMAYGVYRDVTLDAPQAVRGGGTDDTLGQWGAVLQGGLFVADDLELFARYEIGSTDTDKYRTSATALDANGEDASVATFGLNWWPAGVKNRGIKFTGDVGYAFDPLVDFAASGANWQSDYTESGGATSDGQWLVRTQLQFQF